MPAWYGVVGDLYDREGRPYMHVGELDTQDYDRARETAVRYASSHPNASALILRDGEPHAWVFHSYDHGRGETIVRIRGCGGVHDEWIVNGRVVRTRNG